MSEGLITGVPSEGLVDDSNDRFTVHRYTHHGGEVVQHVLYTHTHGETDMERDRQTETKRERDRQTESERE